MCRRHDKTEHRACWSHPGSGASPVRLAAGGASVPGHQCAVFCCGTVPWLDHSFPARGRMGSSYSLSPCKA